MPYSEVLIRWTNIDWNLTQSICIMPNEIASLCVFWLFSPILVPIFSVLTFLIIFDDFNFFSPKSYLPFLPIFERIWTFLRISIFNFYSRIWQRHKNCCHQQRHQRHRRQLLHHSLRHFLNLRSINSIQAVIRVDYIHLRHIQIHLELCRVFLATMWVQNIKNHFHYQFHP